MNIVQMTNTYLPHVGGVARSVESFAGTYRRLGHRVLIVAPEFEETPAVEADVVRMPAIVRFNGSDFSVPMPVPGRVSAAIDRFEAEVVHAHHPFLLGDTALRVASSRNLPVVFTHHTLYERYTHYVPGDSPAMRRFAIDLVVGYCNLCDAVIAPSESIRDLIAERGVTSPTTVIPTGVEVERFAGGDGSRFREAEEIPPGALVVGHVGRLAPEKNLDLLARSVSRFVAERPDARFVVVGSGPSMEVVRKRFEERGVADRLHLTGTLSGSNLVDAYHAMDVFAFASCTETQGMVLAEAMAAGVPVVAVDAPGVREVVRDRENGRLIPGQDEEGLVRGLAWVADLDPAERARIAEAVAATAAGFSLETTARKALDLYSMVRAGRRRRATLLDGSAIEQSAWAKARRRIGEEWRIILNIASAVGESMLHPGEEPEADATLEGD